MTQPPGKPPILDKETHCDRCGKHTFYCKCTVVVTRWADPEEDADNVLETEDEDVSTEDYSK